MDIVQIFFMTTKERIVEKALAMFNERGIEYVSLRELAATLNIRVGNITYYFPTKDDLVNQLSMDLNELNSAIVVEQRDLTLIKFLEMFRIIFQHHVQYRCLLLSFVHLMEQNKILASRYPNTHLNRNATLISNITHLIQSGYLKAEVIPGFLLSMISLIVRFWISEAKVSFSHLTPEAQIGHYTALIARFLLPYATAKGKREISIFLQN